MYLVLKLTGSKACTIRISQAPSFSNMVVEEKEEEEEENAIGQMLEFEDISEDTKAEFCIEDDGGKEEEEEGEAFDHDIYHQMNDTVE